MNVTTRRAVLGRFSLPLLTRLSLVVVAAGAMLPGTGCSFIFSKPPREEDYHSTHFVECSTNPAPPLVDTLFTLTNLMSVGMVAVDDKAQDKAPAIGLGLAVAALWVSSAIHGFRAIEGCKEAKTDEPYLRPRVLRPPRGPAALTYPAAAGGAPVTSPTSGVVPPSPVVTPASAGVAPADGGLAGAQPPPYPNSPLAAPPQPPAPPVPQQQDDDDPVRAPKRLPAFPKH